MQRADDLRLAREAARGSTEAWHEFVHRYSGLIFSVVRRYLADGDEDEWRDAYVRVLESFYRFGLARYDGHASLSTWVITVSRSRCLDILRNWHGRKRRPAWLRRLPPRVREIYRLYFVNGKNFSDIVQEFQERGWTLTAAEFRNSLERLERRMDRRLRTRLAYDLQVRSVRSVSSQLLEYMDHLRLEQEGNAEAQQPDFELVQAQARRLLDEIRSCVQRLEGLEQQVVQLHFYGDLPAARIAAELELPGPRRAYTLLERALASLRRMLAGAPEAARISFEAGRVDIRRLPRRDRSGE